MPAVAVRLEVVRLLAGVCEVTEEKGGATLNP
jgi:uncharacterized cupin superfamily protein